MDDKCNDQYTKKATEYEYARIAFIDNYIFSRI